MASTDRRSARHLITQIMEDGAHFTFFQAVRLLALSRDRCSEPLPIPPGIRFRTPLSLSFPASDILAVQHRSASPPATATEDTPHASDAAEEDRLAVDMTVGFMGLTGPTGVLPSAYTELLIARRHLHRDTAAHAFIDIFSHRAISLFYEAWRKNRFYLAYEAGERHGFTRNLLDLVGVGLTPLQSRLSPDSGGIPDTFLAHFAGILARKPVSAINLAAVLRGYLGVDVQIQQFVGQWIAVPSTEQSRLGMHSCQLGDTAVAGERIWDRQTKMRLQLGPLTSDRFTDFLPGQKGSIAVKELVRFCLGQTLACDLMLILHQDHVRPASLQSASASARRLGYDAWLHTHPVHAHPQDACFTLLE